MPVSVFKLRIMKSSVFSLSRGAWSPAAAKLHRGCLMKAANLGCRAQVWKESTETGREGPCKDWNPGDLETPWKLPWKLGERHRQCTQQ